MSRSARNLLAITAATGAALSLMAAASVPAGRPQRRFGTGTAALALCADAGRGAPGGRRVAAGRHHRRRPAADRAGDRQVLARAGVHRRHQGQPQLPDRAALEPARLRVRVRRPARHGRLVRHAHRRTGQHDDRRRGLARGLDRRAALVERAGRRDRRVLLGRHRDALAGPAQPAHHRRRADLLRLRSLRGPGPPGRDSDPAADRPLRAAAADPRQGRRHRPAPPVPRPSRSARRPG